MSELFTLFASDTPADATVSALLTSDDRKSRVAAYAYVYAHPDSARIAELVDAVAVEDTRFGQYWGVRALHRQVEADPAALDAATRRRLEHLLTTLEPASDAADELRQLLHHAPT
jgi:hypothetical protein